MCVCEEGGEEEGVRREGERGNGVNGFRPCSKLEVAILPKEAEGREGKVAEALTSQTRATQCVCTHRWDSPRLLPSASTRR